MAVESECSATGEILLRAVSLPSWQSVILPRLRDSLDEEPEVDVDRQLDVLAGRYRTALDTWTDCIAELPFSLTTRLIIQTAPRARNLLQSSPPADCFLGIEMSICSGTTFVRNFISCGFAS